MGWTEERVEQLRTLWTEGLSASQIARVLGGVTRNAVIGKVHRLGLSGRAKSPSSATPRPRKPRSSGHMLRVSRPAVRGNTAPGSDSRTAVILAPAERDLILREMRGFLSGVHDILDGLNKNDMKQVASAARRIGMQSAVDVNPALMTKLPLQLKQLGMSVHRDMDDLAAAAEDVPEHQRRRPLHRQRPRFDGLHPPGQRWPQQGRSAHQLRNHA